MKRELSSELVTAKIELRRAMRATLRSMDPETRAVASLEICRRVAALPAFREATTLALFAPLPSEPDIHPLIEEAWARGKRVAFPLMREVDPPRIEWHQVTSWEEMIVAGPFGLREPDPVRCPSIKVSAIQLILVPGLAFDARGVRLGRGGGYYDSVLVQLPPETVTLGLMFACQQVPEVPRESHDHPLETILIEAS